MEAKEWITTQEAADRPGDTTARIRQMVAENQISSRRLGSKYRGQWQILANLKTNYNEALRLMKQNNIRHLPIVDAKGRPEGIVTRSDKLHAEPSPVTTLNVFEIASLLDTVTMEKMTSPVLAVDESCSITNAANFMLSNKIDSLLVMREGILAGIITIADIFRTFIEITGGGLPGSRIEARLPNQKGHLAPFIQALSNAGSEDEIRNELDKLGYVEIISFRQNDSDKFLTFDRNLAT